MMKMVSPAAFTLLVILNVGLVAAQCSKPPVIFNFGDSNSDSGGSAALLGGPFVHPDGRTYFNRPTGRLCDGRLMIDFLCKLKLDIYISLKTLGVQISEFSRFYNRSIELFGRLDLHLLGEDDFQNALYTIDIGQNDLAAAFQQGTYDRVVTVLIPYFMLRIRDAMQAIYKLGGKKFWVHGTGPLGYLPRQLASRNASSKGGLDKYGCDSDMNEAAKQFNLGLDRLCQQLRFEMENSTIVYVDVYSIKYDLIAASSSYGFVDPLMACCGYGGPPYNVHPGIDCRSPGHNECPVGSPPHISWDGTHYTEAANAIVASKILSTNYSSPPLPFNFFCNP